MIRRTTGPRGLHLQDGGSSAIPSDSSVVDPLFVDRVEEGYARAGSARVDVVGVYIPQDCQLRSSSVELPGDWGGIGY
jgi:hypothetical protein